MPGVIFDVRSPGEYQQGRIPGSISLPLFSNEERAKVGTTYKQINREAAVELGIEIAGPKAINIVGTAKKAVQARSPNNLVAKVYCWRGGMRSHAIATLLSAAGISSITLQGGYKTFRRWCLETLKRPQNLVIIGGRTGTGKTAILHALQNQGEQVLNLEALACHRGSAYGIIPGEQQPSTEQFENEIAWQWNGFNPQKPVWIEGESRLIGKCKIPDALFYQMTQAPIFLVDRPLEERLDIIYRDYHGLSEEQLITATQNIAKKLGSERAQKIITAIRSKTLHRRDAQAVDFFVESILSYYDKTYHHAIHRCQQPLYTITGQGWSDEQWAEVLQQSLVSSPPCLDRSKRTCSKNT